MKTGKFLASILVSIAILSLLFTACSQPSPTPTPTPSPSPSPSPTATPTPTTPPPTAEVYEWRAQSVATRGSVDFISMEWAAELMKEASDGRLIIIPQGADEIVPFGEEFDAVSGGQLEVGLGDPSFHMGISGGVSALAAWPFAFPVRDDSVAYQELKGGRDLTNSLYEQHGVYLVKSMGTGKTDFWVTTFDVNSLADFKGKKMRTLGLYGEVLSEAVPEVSIVFLPGGELYTGLERGLVEGCVFGPIVFATDWGIQEVVDYLITPAFGVAGLDIMVNMDLWNDLPDDLKAIFELGMNYYEVMLNGAYADETAARLYSMREDHGIITKVLPAEDYKALAEASVRVLDRYAEQDATFAQGAEIVKAFMVERGLL